MEFVLGAIVFFIGVITGATIKQPGQNNTNNNDN